MVRRRRVFAGTAAVHARAGPGVPRRVPGGAQPVPGAAREHRPDADPPLPEGDVVRPGPERVPPALLGPSLRGGRRSRRGPGRRHRARGDGPAAADRVDARLVPAVAAVLVDRQRRTGLVLVRLGIVAARNRLPGDLPRQRGHRPATARPDPAALAAVPARVRGGPDQDARRPVLAGSDVPVLPPRDPADAGPAELVLPPPAQAPAPGRGGREPRHPARGALLPVRAAADRGDRGVDHDRHPVVAGGQRQLLLAELAGDRAGPVGDPGQLVGASAAARTRSGVRDDADGVRGGGRGADRDGRGAQATCRCGTCSPTGRR